MHRLLFLTTALTLLMAGMASLRAEVSVGAVSVFEDINNDTAVTAPSTPVRLVAARGG